MRIEGREGGGACAERECGFCFASDIKINGHYNMYFKIFSLLINTVLLLNYSAAYSSEFKFKIEIFWRLVYMLKFKMKLRILCVFIISLIIYIKFKFILVNITLNRNFLSFIFWIIFYFTFYIFRSPFFKLWIVSQQKVSSSWFC